MAPPDASRPTARAITDGEMKPARAPTPKAPRRTPKSANRASVATRAASRRATPKRRRAPPPPNVNNVFSASRLPKNCKQFWTWPVTSWYLGELGPHDAALLKDRPFIAPTPEQMPPPQKHYRLRWLKEDVDHFFDGTPRPNPPSVEPLAIHVGHGKACERTFWIPEDERPRKKVCRRVKDAQQDPCLYVPPSDAISTANGGLSSPTGSSTSPDAQSNAKVDPTDPIPDRNVRMEDVSESITPKMIHNASAPDHLQIPIVTPSIEQRPQIALQFVSPKESRLMATITYSLPLSTSTDHNNNQQNPTKTQRPDHNAKPEPKLQTAVNPDNDSDVVLEDFDLDFRYANRPFIADFNDINARDELGPEVMRLNSLIDDLVVRTKPLREVASNAVKAELDRQNRFADMKTEEEQILARLKEIEEEKKETERQRIAAEKQQLSKEKAERKTERKLKKTPSGRGRGRPRIVKVIIDDDDDEEMTGVHVNAKFALRANEHKIEETLEIAKPNGAVVISSNTTSGQHATSNDAAALPVPVIEITDDADVKEGAAHPETVIEIADDSDADTPIDVDEKFDPESHKSASQSEFEPNGLDGDASAVKSKPTRGLSEKAPARKPAIAETATFKVATSENPPKEQLGANVEVVEKTKPAVATETGALVSDLMATVAKFPDGTNVLSSLPVEQEPCQFEERSSPVTLHETLASQDIETHTESEPATGTAPSVEKALNLNDTAPPAEASSPTCAYVPGTVNVSETLFRKDESSEQHIRMPSPVSPIQAANSGTALVMVTHIKSALGSTKAREDSLMTGIKQIGGERGGGAADVNSS